MQCNCTGCMCMQVLSPYRCQGSVRRARVILCCREKNEDLCNLVTVVHWTGTALPRADYISDGAWAISTLKPIIFNVLCHEKPVSVITARAPLSVITLGMTCVG